MSTKQHYVPNFILRKFASRDRTLWILDKSTGNCWSKRGGKRNRYDDFVQNNYLPQKVDDTIGLREYAAAPLILRILVEARSGVASSLSDTDKTDLCRFLVNQILRGPRVKKFAEKLHSQFYYSMLKDDLDGARDSEYPERDLFQKMTHMQLVPAIVDANTNNLLVISDEPCWFTYDVVVMRIAKDAIIQLHNVGESGPGVHILDSNWVTKLNRESINKADRFIAGPNRATLQTPYSDIS